MNILRKEKRRNMYKIIIRPGAEKFLNRLIDEDFDRLSDAILKLVEEPYPYGAEKLIDSIYRIRIGQYRIIYRVEEKDCLFLITEDRIRKFRNESYYERLKEIINKEFSRTELVKKLKGLKIKQEKITEILDYAEEIKTIDIGKVDRRKERTYKGFKGLFQ
jgi:mRNA interferase RelE/StbE